MELCKGAEKPGDESDMEEMPELEHQATTSAEPKENANINPTFVRKILKIFKKSKKEEPKIINLAVHLEKLTAQLSDGRELSIPLEWFAKWGVKGVSAEKLRKYEIKRGVNVYFPDIDEVLGIEVFTKGFDADCE